MLCPKAVVGTVNKKKVKKDYSNTELEFLRLYKRDQKEMFYLWK